METIPQKIVQSNETILNVDRVRFTFKISILVHRAHTSYLNALKDQDSDKLYDAIDYFDAAVGFLTIKYTRNDALISYVQPRIDKSIAIIEAYGLTIPEQELQKLQKLVSEISYFTEQKEKNVWQDIQHNYIEFRTHEYELIKMQQVIAIIVSFLFIISLLMYYKQNRLNKVILSHEEELKQLAFFDTLTKIPNRKNIESILNQQLLRAIRYDNELYIALIDIDNFKQINDLYGHEYGDIALVETTQRLKKIIRNEDITGRLGGDEFLLIFDQNVKYDELTQLLDRIISACNQPVTINNAPFQISISMGISHFPNDADTSQDLIKCADITMYRAKDDGKNQYQFYDQTLGQRIKREYELDLEIKRALKHNEFELYYQPQIDTQSQQVIGAEALIRWNHPTRGLVMPAEFIDVVEKGYQVREFGEWIITHAAQQQKEWQKQGLSLSISVNLSVKHILSSDFYFSISALIEEHEIDFKRIIFEITEYEVVGYNTHPVQELKKLSDQGFTFHLDDFGTGYSSISYLSQLPVSCIKIDKSFVDKITPDNNQSLLIDAIINISMALNIKITAEGVEDQYQFNYLKEKNCNTIQGYFFARPMKQDDFIVYINQQNAPSAQVKPSA